MKCIYCEKKETEVVNSRGAKGGLQTWRRRKCSSCGMIFTTKETAQSDNLFVIKSSGKRQRFVYEKLFASLFSILSTQKDHDNGDDALLAKKLSSSVMGILHRTADDKNIRTSDIIVAVFGELKKEDSALAERYIYYSAYRRKVGLKARLIK